MITVNRPMRLVVINIVLFTLLAICVWCLLTLGSAASFPIQHIKIHGNYKHIDRAQIERLVKPHVGSSFFRVDLNNIKHALLTETWLKSAKVTRIWPNQLIITLDERSPVAIWNSEHLMTSQGVVFSSDAEAFMSTLPMLSGPRDKEAFMFEKYNEFNAILSPLDLHINQLLLTSSMVWSMRLDNDVELMLGENDARGRLLRFVAVYPKILTAKHHRAKRFDLRYGDGVAVKWR